MNSTKAVPQQEVDRFQGIYEELDAENVEVTQVG